MPESILWGAGYGSTSHDFSSRTMYMRLDQFDQIYLNCENCFLVRHINLYNPIPIPDYVKCGVWSQVLAIEKFITIYW